MQCYAMRNSAVQCNTSNVMRCNVVETSNRTDSLVNKMLNHICWVIWTVVETRIVFFSSCYSGCHHRYAYHWQSVLKNYCSRWLKVLARQPVSNNARDSNTDNIDTSRTLACCLCQLYFIDYFCCVNIFNRLHTTQWATTTTTNINYIPIVTYLYNSLSFPSHSVSTGSSDSLVPSIPNVRSSLGKRAFSVIGPRLWNPPDTRK